MLDRGSRRAWDHVVMVQSGKSQLPTRVEHAVSAKDAPLLLTNSVQRLHPSAIAVKNNLGPVRRLRVGRYRFLFGNENVIVPARNFYQQKLTAKAARRASPVAEPKQEPFPDENELELMTFFGKKLQDNFFQGGTRFLTDIIGNVHDRL